MLRKINFIFLILVFPLEASSEPNNLEEYMRTLTFGCAQDSDCVVKQAFNCCGSLTMCVLETATPKKETVDNLCKQQAMMAICGFTPVRECRCVNQNCENHLPIAQ